MKKLTTFLIVILSIAIAVLVAVKFFILPYKEAAKEDAARAANAKTIATVVDSEASAEEVSTEQVVTEEEAPAEETVDEEDSTMETFDFDVSKATALYIGDITQEIIDTFVENLNNSWDVGERTKEDFIEEHPEIFGEYPRDKDGKLMVPWSDAQMVNKDHERQNAAKALGLETEPINDALDFPNDELTVADVKAINAARANQVVKLEKDIQLYEISIFKDWLSKPVVFESFINLLLDQKIGSDFILRNNWTGPTKFTEEYDRARADGIGVNRWLRCFEDQSGSGNQYFYTNVEYIYDYVIPLIAFFYEQPFSCEVLTSTEHYHLIAGDNDTMRKAELANYRDNKAAFVWRILLKDNGIGLMPGVNARDGRPEILNYTVVSKPPKSTKKDDITPPPVEQQQQQVVVVTTTSTTTTETPSSPSEEPHNDPDKPDTPDNPQQEEVKIPSQGSASQGNAQVGGGTSDDAGAGEKKADQGNSKSSTVEGSQYQQGTSSNTTADKTTYDQGEAADKTVGGTVPDTSKSITTEESKKNDDYVTSSSASSSSSADSASSGSSTTPAKAGTSSDNTTEIVEPETDD